MDRRGFVGLCTAACAGCLRNPPGQTGPRNPPTGSDGTAGDGGGDGSGNPLEVTTLDFEETADGQLRVFGTVANAAGTERVATVRVTVTVEGAESVGSTEVEVPAGGTTEFEVTFAVAYKRFAKKGSISVELV